MTLKDEFLKFRAKHNISQKELSKLLGAKGAYVARTESGETTPTKKNELRFKQKLEELERNICDEKNTM